MRHKRRDSGVRQLVQGSVRLRLRERHRIAKARMPDVSHNTDYSCIAQRFTVMLSPIALALLDRLQ